jgi:OmpA-OmpF porin, OOP family
MLKKWFVAMLGAAAMVVSGGAFAQKQQAAPLGFYVGGEFGKFDIDSEDDTAFKILGGYQFHKNFAAEFSYASLFDKSGIEITAWELVGVASYPLANKFSIFGKLGFAKWETDAGIFGSEDGTDLTFGVGVQYDLTPKIALRGQWQRYDVSDENADLFSIGLIYRF